MTQYVSVSELFPGTSQMHSFLHTFDWSGFAAGHPEQWGPALRASVNIMLDCGFPSAVCVGPDLRLIYNQAYMRMIDARHPSAFANPMAEAWSDVWPELEPLLQQSLQGQAGIFEDFPATIDGAGTERRCFTFSHSPLRDEEGQIIGLFCVLSETTDQVFSKQRHGFQLALSEALRGSFTPQDILSRTTALLAEQLQADRVGYAEVDDQGLNMTIGSEWAAPGMESLTGRKVELSCMGSSLGGELSAGMTICVDDIDADHRCVGPRAALESMHARAVLALPVVQEGLVKAVLYVHQKEPRSWTVLDVTLAQDMLERTWSTVANARAQAELRQERDRSQYIFDSMTEGFAVIDKDWTVTQMNAEGLRIGRREACEVIGKNHWKVWADARGSAVERLYRSVRDNGVPGVTEHMYTFAGTDSVWLETRAYPTADQGLAVFFRDITQRKLSEQQLRESNLRKDEFLAMLAHELRNPLAPIGAAAEVLQLAQFDEQRIRQTSQIIARQVRHMTSLVDDLLDVSRVTRGLVTLESSDIDLREVLMEAVEQIGPLIRSRAHTLHLDLPPKGTVVHADRKRLVQVFANLLNNAAKYTERGGRIELRHEFTDGQCLLTISDSGMGMDPALANRVFDLFVQASRTSDRSSGGLGLGLALVKSLVELHGGSVSCSSEGEGRGSCFSIWLPLPDQDRHLVDSASHQPRRAPFRSLRVLIVDDNRDAARMLAMLLEAYGHQVLVEFSARRALIRAATERPEVCLLDIGLPEMDGYELARHLRDLSETRSAVLVAITGYGQEEDRLAARKAGFDHHLVKPVDIDELSRVLSEISARKSSLFP